MIRLYIVIFIFILSTPVTAQLQSVDSSFVLTAVENAKKIHAKKIIGESNLYNGSDFAEYRPLDDEHPYLGSDDWIFGTVQYNGEVYEDIAMLYDIHKDILIIENYNYGAKVQLVKRNIQYFTFGHQTFLHLLNNTIPQGFYEVLYDGQTKAYARHEKIFVESVSANQLNRDFEKKTKYFIYKEGVYHHVKSKGSVLKVFEDHKRELNQLAHREQIRFSANREYAMIRMSQLYDSIKK